MGLLDDWMNERWDRDPDVYEPAGTWQSSPAPDGRYVGIRPALPKSREPYYGMPDKEPMPDHYPFFQAAPAAPEEERAYYPTLRWEDSIPGELEAQRLYEAQVRAETEPYLARARDEFRRPKTLEEIFQGWLSGNR